MKLLINRQPVRGQAWGGGAWFVNAIYDNAHALGHQVLTVDEVKQGHKPDVILLIGLDADGMGLTAQSAVEYARTCLTRNCIKIPIVIRVNECDARKGTFGVDNAWRLMSQYVDGTIFVSEWLKSYFYGWSCSNTCVIRNGVDALIFYPRQKTNDGKLHLVTHHWSNNPMKGFDIYNAIDDYVAKHNDVTFTYIGRDRGTFQHSTIVAPLHGEALGTELGKHNVYVSASRFDPGPNHVLEAISCELPTFVHPDGGGAVEFAGSSYVFSSIDDLVARAKQARFDQQKPGSWYNCARACFEFLEMTWKTSNVSLK